MSHPDVWRTMLIALFVAQGLHAQSPSYPTVTVERLEHPEDGDTTPVVNRGRMFITTPQNNIIALDAKTGNQLWRYARKYPDGLFQLHPTNRGVALYGNYVYMATTDCALVALDAATGKDEVPDAASKGF